MAGALFHWRGVRPTAGETTQDKTFAVDSNAGMNTFQTAWSMDVNNVLGVDQNCKNDVWATVEMLDVSTNDWIDATG